MPSIRRIIDAIHRIASPTIGALAAVGVLGVFGSSSLPVSGASDSADPLVCPPGYALPPDYAPPSTPTGDPVLCLSVDGSGPPVAAQPARGQDQTFTDAPAPPPPAPPTQGPPTPGTTETTNTTTAITIAPPPPPTAPRPAPSRWPATRLGRPKVESKVAPPRRPPARPAPRRQRQASPLDKLSNGGGVSGTAPSLPITSPMAPSTSSSVPNLILDRFPIPPFLLPIYQAAGTQYDVPWQVLAAINEIETDYGRNLSVSSAGAQGWMQFMPSSWRTYGVDANADGRKDPYNPADAIFAAARYLKAAGADKDLRQSIFSYNHAWWYVDSVMLRAKLVRALPSNLVSSLTALTQGRIPVSGPARWVRVQRHHNLNPQLVVESPPAASVVAANDGQVVQRGYDRRRGAYLTLRDAYGNTYSYTHLGSVARQYAMVRPTVLDVAGDPTAPAGPADPRPKGPATAGGQRSPTAIVSSAVAAAAGAPTVVKERLFAQPERPGSYSAGGSRQVAELALGAPVPRARVSAYFAGPVRLRPQDLVLRPLRPGAQVLAGTVLGHVGPASPGAVLSDTDFGVRPAGAPAVNPKPFVNGWHLLAASGVYGGGAAEPLRLDALHRASVGQILLMTKDQLIQAVLSDPRIRIYPCGRRDVATGQIDRRVLATLEYLAANDLRPLVSALKCGHSYLTSAGTVSEHSYGDAVDIASINGTPILGHQGKGSITDVTISKLLQLQGTMKPHQIISLMKYPGTDNTLSLPDHADHIHVGFYPGGAAGPGGPASALPPGQWTRLVDHLGEIENPTLQTPAPRTR